MKSNIIFLKTRRDKKGEEDGISKAENASTSNQKGILQNPGRSNRKSNCEKHGTGIKFFRFAANPPLLPNQEYVGFETGHEMAKESQGQLEGISIETGALKTLPRRQSKVPSIIFHPR